MQNQVTGDFLQWKQAECARESTCVPTVSIDSGWLSQSLMCVCWCVFVSRTLGVPVVRGVLRQPVEVIFEEQLIARNPLNRLQHVMLQSQVTTTLLPLHKHSSNNSSMNTLTNKTTSRGQTESGSIIAAGPESPE